MQEGQKLAPEQYAKVVEVTNKLNALLKSSMLFDEVTRIGPTSMQISLYSYDPEVREGFTLECKLGVSL